MMGEQKLQPWLVLRTRQLFSHLLYCILPLAHDSDLGGVQLLSISTLRIGGRSDRMLLSHCLDSIISAVDNV
jgi:hypothetical protein